MYRTASLYNSVKGQALALFFIENPVIIAKLTIGMGSGTI